MGKKATMRDISKNLNISINAVSLALNNKAGVSEETRKIVFEEAEELGYLEKSNKFIENYASKNICVMIKKIYFKDNYFYSKILMGVAEEARRNGFDIITSLVDELDSDIPKCIENKKICGVIAIGAINDETLIKIKSYKIPIILVDYSSYFEEIDSILTDNKYGSFKLTTYLIENGHENIGFFGDLDYSQSVVERYIGYFEAIKKISGLTTKSIIKEYIEKYSVLEYLEGDIINSDVNKIVEKVKSIKQMPTAFVCSNDNAAIMLIAALNQLGIEVPNDVSVVGFDNIALSNIVIPNITTISVEKELMGKKALQRLLYRLDNKNEMYEKIVMGVKFIERNSVAKKSVFGVEDEE